MSNYIIIFDSKALFVKDKLLEIYDIPEELVEELLVEIYNCMHESEAGEDLIENDVEAGEVVKTRRCRSYCL